MQGPLTPRQLRVERRSQPRDDRRRDPASIRDERQFRPAADLPAALAGSRTAAATAALHEGKSRRDELVHIEETLVELAALMQQVRCSSSPVLLLKLTVD